MSITGIESTVAANSTGQSANGAAKLADNFNTFLNMLTVQLKHQDPLSPMDSTQFTSQLVQFANVEQQINANSNLEKLISLNQVNQNSFALNYIGHTIEANTDSVPLQGSSETATDQLPYYGGTAAFSYTLPQGADNVTISIKDASGNTVRTIAGSTSTGRHVVEWDGSDAYGAQSPDGTYTLSVAATDTAGNAIAATTGVVTQTGKAGFSYTLADDAQSVAVVVKDASGKIIRNLPGQGGKGRHEMAWDGKDSNGRNMPDGAYKLEVVATSATGEPVDATTTVYGRVTDIAADGKETLLNMSGVVTTIDKVLTVRESAAVQSVN